MLTSGGIQVGWGSQWETLANAINDYYGGGISSAQYQQVVQMLNSGEYTMEEMESVIGNIPEFNRVYNANGKLTSVTYNATSAGNTAAGSIANEINSNAASATNTQFQTVQTITKDSQTGKVTMSDSVKKYNGGVASTTKAVATSTLQGILAAGVGIKLGKTISQLAYDNGFNYLEWAGVSMESLNPETWAEISEEASEDHPFRSAMFNMIFDLDPNTGNPQAYIDENAFAYMTAYMIATGVFSQTEYEGSCDEETRETLTYDFYPASVSLNTKTEYYSRISLDNLAAWNWKIISQVGTVYSIACAREGTNYGTYGNSYMICFLSTSPFVAGRKWGNAGDYPTTGENATQSTTHKGTTYYYTLYGTSSEGNYPVLVPSFFYDDTPDGERMVKDLATIIFDGDIEQTSGVEGITDQTGATQFDDAGLDPTDIAAILAALMTQFPELWDNRIEVSPDGDNVIKYLPIGFPTGGVGQEPTTDGATAADTRPDISGGGENATDELIKTLIDLIQQPYNPNGMESDTDIPTEPIDPNGDGTGSGNTPIPILPIGSAEALYSVYNPTQAQLNSFGSWLWSSNFVDQLLKLFNDPMQAIIGLHKVFATPSIGGTSTIKVGYLDSGVSSKTVSNQYTEVDCGTVSLPEYFKNCLDYTDTDVYIYLPFIGIEALNVEDVTRAKINVKYKVDVLTGACLAMVNVTRDSNAGGQLYVYPGNCAVQYPLSSGSYMGIVTAGLSAAATIAGIIGTGGAAAPALTAANVAKGVGHGLGIASGFMSSARNNVSRSGNLSGNSGAMGIKKPYLIIRRPQTKIADNFSMDGISENKYGVLSSFTGMTKVKYIHLENIPCTGEELTMIEDILKEDVLI